MEGRGQLVPRTLDPRRGPGESGIAGAVGSRDSHGRAMWRGPSWRGEHRSVAHGSRESFPRVRLVHRVPLLPEVRVAHGAAAWNDNSEGTKLRSERTRGHNKQKTHTQEAERVFRSMFYTGQVPFVAK